MAGCVAITGSVEQTGVADVTVTVKVPVVSFPNASVPVQVTVVVPTGKVEPDGGSQLLVTGAPASVHVGV